MKCLNCGEKIEDRPYNILIKEREFFCSDRCFNEYRKNVAKKTKVKK